MVNTKAIFFFLSREKEAILEVYLQIQCEILSVLKLEI